MPDTDTLLSCVLPADVRAVCTGATPPDDGLLPAEVAALGHVVPRRRAEYAAVRRCARHALAELGFQPVPILSGPRREPVWPAGVVGSMTHCHGFYAAAVAWNERYCSLGIDAEPHQPLPAGVLRLVASQREQRMLVESDLGSVHLGRVLFSAKESIYKAWFPLTNRWLGFLDVDLLLTSHQQFRARVLADVPERYRTRLRELHGSYQVSATHIVTAVVVPA